MRVEKRKKAPSVNPQSEGLPEVARQTLKGERLVHLLERGIFFSTLLLIVLAAIPYGSIEFWWASFFEIGVFALTALWSVEAFLGDGFHRRRWDRLLIPCVALTLFSLLQTIPFGAGEARGGVTNALASAVSADPFETFSFARRLAALTLLGALLLRFTTSRRRLHALVFTVIGIGVASALFGMLRQATQRAEMGFGLPALPRGIGYAQIISRNQFAFMMEMALGLAWGMMFRRGRKFETALVYFLLSLPIGAALILANSRGGILTMMCQLLLLAFLVVPSLLSRKEREDGGHSRPPRRGRLLASLVARVVLVIALLGAAAVAVVWVGGERVVSNLSTVREELGPEGSPARWNVRRVDIWRATVELIKDHPLVGVGFGGYWTAIPQYHNASGAYTPQQAHNDYLELLASGGVIGLIIFLWFAFLLLKRIREVLLHADRFRRAACLGALLGLFGIAVHSLFDFGLHMTINAALCVALIAIATVDVQEAGPKE
ncbi:MAG TPA: O-antigen ligase family protein [Pyrinomonadaceae bacterium]